MHPCSRVTSEEVWLAGYSREHDSAPRNQWLKQVSGVVVYRSASIYANILKKKKSKLPSNSCLWMSNSSLLDMLCKRVQTEWRFLPIC